MLFLLPGPPFPPFSLGLSPAPYLLGLFLQTFPKTLPYLLPRSSPTQPLVERRGPGSLETQCPQASGCELQKGLTSPAWTAVGGCSAHGENSVIASQASLRGFQAPRPHHRFLRHHSPRSQSWETFLPTSSPGLDLTVQPPPPPHCPLWPQPAGSTTGSLREPQTHTPCPRVPGCSAVTSNPLPWGSADFLASPRA